METTLWGLPVHTSPYVRRGIIEVRYKGELVGQVNNLWGVDLTSLDVDEAWKKEPIVRDLFDQVFRELTKVRIDQYMEPDLLLQHVPDKEDKVDRKTVKLQYEDGSTDTIRGVTGIEIQDDTLYYVLVMFSDDEKHKLYKYACEVQPRLLIGDVVRASVNKAPASVRAVTNDRNGVRLGSLVHECDVLWRKHQDA